MSSVSFARIREGLRLRRPLSYNQLLRARATGRIGFIRAGDNLYLSGEEPLLEEFVNSSDIESFSDVVYENANVGQDFEEINLDTFEINTAETATAVGTSAGAGAVGTSAAGIAAAAPSIPAIVTGVAVAAGVVTIGTTLGVLSNNPETDHTDPVVSFPDHKYLGPGNTVDNTPPVDTDDEIAREHDIAYERARTDEDIHEADHNSANEFLTDAIANNNPHSVAGYIGLKAKETIERQTGVIYGSPTGKQCLV